MMRNTNTKLPYAATNADAITETLLLSVLLLTIHQLVSIANVLFHTRAQRNGYDVSIGTAKCTVLCRFERVSCCCLESFVAADVFFVNVVIVSSFDVRNFQLIYRIIASHNTTNTQLQSTHWR